MKKLLITLQVQVQLPPQKLEQYNKNANTAIWIRFAIVRHEIVVLTDQTKFSAKVWKGMHKQGYAK